MKAEIFLAPDFFIVKDSPISHVAEIKEVQGLGTNAAGSWHVGPIDAEPLHPN